MCPEPICDCTPCNLNKIQLKEIQPADTAGDSAADQADQDAAGSEPTEHLFEVFPKDEDPDTLKDGSDGECLQLRDESSRSSDDGEKKENDNGEDETTPVIEMVASRQTDGGNRGKKTDRLEGVETKNAGDVAAANTYNAYKGNASWWNVHQPDRADTRVVIGELGFEDDPPRQFVCPKNYPMVTVSRGAYRFPKKEVEDREKGFRLSSWETAETPWERILQLLVNVIPQLADVFNRPLHTVYEIRAVSHGLESVQNARPCSNLGVDLHVFPNDVIEISKELGPFKNPYGKERSIGKKGVKDKKDVEEKKKAVEDKIKTLRKEEKEKLKGETLQKAKPAEIDKRVMHRVREEEREKRKKKHQAVKDYKDVSKESFDKAKSRDLKKKELEEKEKEKETTAAKNKKRREKRKDRKKTLARKKKEAEKRHKEHETKKEAGRNRRKKELDDIAARQDESRRKNDEETKGIKTDAEERIRKLEEERDRGKASACLTPEESTRLEARRKEFEEEEKRIQESRDRKMKDRVRKKLNTKSWREEQKRLDAESESRRKAFDTEEEQSRQKMLNVHKDDIEEEFNDRKREVESREQKELDALDQRRREEMAEEKRLQEELEQRHQAETDEEDEESKRLESELKTAEKESGDAEEMDRMKTAEEVQTEKDLDEYIQTKTKEVKDDETVVEEKDREIEEKRKAIDEAQKEEDEETGTADMIQQALLSEAECPITVSRNGVPDPDIAAMMKIIGIIQKIIFLIRSIKDIVNKAPKAGWYMEFDVGFLEGSFGYRCGFREKEEAVSKTVYYWGALSADITLAKLELTLGFGVKWTLIPKTLLAEAVVEGSLTGAVNINEQVNIICDRKENQWLEPDPVNAELTFKIEGRIIIGNPNVAEARADVTAPFVVKLELPLASFGNALEKDKKNENPSLRLSARASMNDIYFKFKVKVFFGWVSKNYKKKLVDHWESGTAYWDIWQNESGAEKGM